jgi:predicted dienelactone hydrolase
VHATVIASPLAATRQIGRLPRRPSGRRILAVLLLGGGLTAATASVSTLAYLRLPGVTGPAAVGRVETLLTDTERPERLSSTGDDRRVPLTVWYPAADDASPPAPYVPQLATVAAGLEASGELSGVQVAGLGLVTPNARAGAAVATSEPTYPVVLLSPGNATNVAFYGALAEELASHDYVVVGIDHPYQSAAVDVGNGRVAVYAGNDAPTASVALKIEERVADIAFVLDRLVADAAGLSRLQGRLDLEHVAVVGHSNGGIAAAEACMADARISACVNIDGQAAGGPFSAAARPTVPRTPFLFLTKETVLHPALEAVFEAAPVDAYRVVVPAAAHGDFSDGARFEPRVLPVDSTADAVLTIERGFALAFLDHELRGAPESRFRSVAAATDVTVMVYPLGNPHAPRGPLP